MTHAVIVSHGQPGNPGPQQDAIEALAAAVASHHPGLSVRGATLAMPGALAHACAAGNAGKGRTQGGDDADRDMPDDDGAGCLIYPMFMAEGWFTRSELPRRLAQAGAGRARITRPFGTDPALPQLIVSLAIAGAAGRGWDLADTTLLLAAHGSQRSQASHDITEAMARLLRPQFAAVTTGYVEQAPFLVDAARGLDRAICLPMFALRAEHVLEDLPEALDDAGFQGVRLAPLGVSPEVPMLIAATLRQQVQAG